jgi:uncharacterized membrane protein
VHVGRYADRVLNRREALGEYLRGALWVLPAISVVLAMGVGSGLSSFNVPAGSPLHRLVFQGTADDARTLLIGIAGTTITVIALMLGLTVVALQLSSTQFSPRILRNFLRDRPNQLVLSVFVGTFAYAMAGLYTVGVSAGERTADFPRLAISGAIGCLFLSLGALVYEVHHISHSMQVDEIMRKIERNTTAVIHDGLPAGDSGLPPVPAHAVAVAAHCSGYLQTVHLEYAAAYAAEHNVHVRLTRRVGQHIVAGSPLAWAWTDSGSAPDPAGLPEAVAACVRIGFERTDEQDAAFGLRQLVDIASKALSPAVNDPYTAVQAIDHLAIVLASLAARPLGSTVLVAGPSGSVAAPALEFSGFLDLACAQIRRYGSSEPMVSRTMIEMLGAAANTLAVDTGGRCNAIAGQLRLILEAAEQQTAQPADLEWVRREGERLMRTLTSSPADGG